MSGHRIKAVLAVVESPNWETLDGAPATALRLRCALSEYERTVLVRFRGKQHTLTKAQAILDDLLAQRARAPHNGYLAYMTQTLQGQLNEAYGVKVSSTLTQDDLSFQGKLGDIINGDTP